VKEKLPEASDISPFCEGSSKIVAPIRGCCESSRTFPVRTPVQVSCAITCIQKSEVDNRNIVFKLMITELNNKISGY
jgi:hypothetical protein